MQKSWTGGQYSLVRFTIATALAWEVLGDGWLSLLAAPVALAVAVGFADRGAAMLLAFGLAMTGPAMLGPAMLGLGDSAIDGSTRWIATAWLVAHAALPNAPYGSVIAHSRENPGGGWTMPAWYPAAAVALFVAMRLGAGVRASLDGEPMTAAALTCLGLLATFPRLLPTAWTLSLGFETGLLLAGSSTTPGACLLHLLALQPAWIPPREQRATQTVFYDGSCALCHGAVRFLLSEDVEPARFRLATIGGRAFASRIPAAERTMVPDSIVLLDDLGRLHTRSDAVLRILDGLGGWWRPLAWLLGALPRPLRDIGYDAVASRRHAWFGRKDPSCVLVATSQRHRFDDGETGIP